MAKVRFRGRAIIAAIGSQPGPLNSVRIDIQFLSQGKPEDVDLNILNDIFYEGKTITVTIEEDELLNTD